jgi:hypothetical protein
VMDATGRLLTLVINLCWYGLGIITGYLISMRHITKKGKEVK